MFKTGWVDTSSTRKYAKDRVVPAAGIFLYGRSRHIVVVESKLCRR